MITDLAAGQSCCRSCSFEACRQCSDQESCPTTPDNSHFTFNEPHCFKRLLSLPARDLDSDKCAAVSTAAVCSTIRITTWMLVRIAEKPYGLCRGHVVTMGQSEASVQVTLDQWEKTYLFCRVQGRRSRVFLCSARLCRNPPGRARLCRMTAATGWSSGRIKSCWRVWNVRIRSQSSLSTIRGHVITLANQRLEAPRQSRCCLCIILHPNKVGTLTLKYWGRVNIFDPRSKMA